MPLERARTTQSGFGKDDDQVAFADGYPLLLIGEASRLALSETVGRELEMLRFRPNLVIEGSAPYAEDNWKRIRIGDIEFRVVKPCARCIMTTVDPQTGERSADREPFATLQKHRSTADGAMFGQNLVNDGNGRLEVGMPVEVLEYAVAEIKNARVFWTRAFFCAVKTGGISRGIRTGKRYRRRLSAGTCCWPGR
jgi:uncharacterized protein YcbX